MPLFDIESIKRKATEEADFYKKKVAGGAADAAKSSYIKERAEYDVVYKVEPLRWYNAYPFSFRYGNQEFNLPIHPNNIHISTLFGNILTPGLYGTIEEHTDQRYFDIVIAGTTGMAPQYFKKNSSGTYTAKKEKASQSLNFKEGLFEEGGVAGKTFIGTYNDATKNANKAAIPDLPGGRASYETFNSPLAGFAAKTMESFNNLKSQVKDFTSMFGNNSELSAIEADKSGYMAFHNFYRFLILYKRKAARGQINSSTSLNFLNYKDGVRYSVMIHTFDLTRSAEDPFLYNYTIRMRAYNMRTLVHTKAPSIDIKDLGLDSVDSETVAAKMNNIARKAKNAAYSAIAGIKAVGS